MLEQSLEKRVSDMEALLNDVPHILNLRLERFDTSFYENSKRFDEINARLNLIDKQMSLISSDMRDLGGGVTRHLTAQGQSIAELRREFKAFKTIVDGRLGQLEDRVARLEMGLGEVQARLTTLETHMTSLGTRMTGLETAIETKMADTSRKLDIVIARLPHA